MIREYLEQPQRNVLGLDVGTSRIVAAQPAGGGVRCASQLNAFVSFPHSAMTEAAFRREGVPFLLHDGEMMIHGNEAPRFADLMNIETRRPMTQGFLNPSEAESLTVVKQIVSSMIEECGQRPTVVYSLPAPPLGGADEAITYHDSTLRHMFGELGCEARSVNEGLAVVYSELEDTNYTGIGISCGGGLCNVALSYLSIPAMAFSVPKAGDFIDSSAASVTSDLANRVRIAKEDRFHFNGHFADKLHQVLTVYYEDLIATLVGSLKDAFSNTRRMPKLGRAVPVVLSGGTAAPPGFRERFEKVLRDSNLPVEISEVRLARDPHTATARGALVMALADEGKPAVSN